MIRKANLVNFVDTDRLVVAGTNKLFACGWVVDVNYSWDVVLVHAQRRGKISHVECIETWEWNKKEDFNISFKQKSNIKFYNYLKSSLATVKTKASIGFQQSELLLIFKTTFLIGEDSLISYKMTLRSLPQVARKIKREVINKMYYCWCCRWPIFFYITQHVFFHLVETNFLQAVDAPLKGFNWWSSRVLPQMANIAASGYQRLGTVMAYTGQHAVGHDCIDGCLHIRTFRAIWFPLFNQFIITNSIKCRGLMAECKISDKAFMSLDCCDKLLTGYIPQSQLFEKSVILIKLVKLKQY